MAWKYPVISLTFEPSFFIKKKKEKGKRNTHYWVRDQRFNNFLVIRLSDKWKRKKATHLDGIKVEGSTSI